MTLEEQKTLYTEIVRSAYRLLEAAYPLGESLKENGIDTGNIWESIMKEEK